MFTQKTGFTLWLTGLSGAGKTTLANALSEILQDHGRKVEVLDGDEVRTNLSKGLGFSKEDRDTNIGRIGYVANLLSRNGVVAITAAISPYREIREEVRRQTRNFFEVYVKCSLQALIERDVKGLYRKALAGEIKGFTGISDPYEEPLNPEVIVETDRETLAESVGKIVFRLRELGYLDSAWIGPIGPHGGKLINLHCGNPHQSIKTSGDSMPDILLTTKQVAEYLKIDKFTVYRLVTQRKVPVAHGA